MTTVTLEKQADVVIIGGGIVGSSLAYFLAKRGANVILLDKGQIAGEQSSRNWGWVGQRGRAPLEIPLLMLSNRIWRKLPEELNADIEWIQGGTLHLVNSEELMARADAWAKEAHAFGLEVQVLPAREVKEKFPAFEGTYVGGTYIPSDGQAEPRKATEAIAKKAIEQGAKIHTYCAVEGIEVANGAIAGVITEHGNIKTKVVVCAAGAWSSKVGRMVGLHLPQRVVRASVANTTPAPHITNANVYAEGVTLRQKRDRSFNIASQMSGIHDVTLESFRNLSLFLPNYVRLRGSLKLHIGAELFDDIARTMPWSSARKHPFAHTVYVEPRPNIQAIQVALNNLHKFIPSVGEIGIARMWAGRIDSTPDAVPVIGEASERVRGLLFGTGLSGHGFAAGPGVGFVLSELILDGKTSIDMHPFRYSRFKEKDLADLTKTAF